MGVGPWLDPTEERAWRALQLMHMRLDGELARQLGGSGLSYPDYAVLVTLTYHPQGRIRLFELARELGWEKSRLSHHVTRMADRGLVEKQPCDSDRRGAYVSVTTRGRAEIAAAAPEHVAAVRRLFFEPLDRDQVVAMGEAAEAVLAALDRECEAADEQSGPR